MPLERHDIRSGRTKKTKTMAMTTMVVRDNVLILSLSNPKMTAETQQNPAAAAQRSA